MNVFRIKFNEWLRDKSDAKAELLDSGPDSAVVVHDGDGLSACNKFLKQKQGRKLAPHKDLETGKRMQFVVAQIDIEGFEALHSDVQILK